MKIVKQFNTALEGGLSKAIFDHLRNLLMCTFLLAIGTTEFTHHQNPFFDFIPTHFSGMGIIGIAFILIGLNIYDGIRQISKSKYHFILTVGFVAAYLLISIRVIGLAWNFRIAL